MSTTLQPLIEALREELQQYGEMLALLDQQQELAITRSSSELLLTVAAVTLQTSAIQQARQRRLSAQQSVSLALLLPADAAFSTMLPLLPLEYRPLLKALVDENNELLVRVQQRARQNHMLLSRSLELMQNFLAAMFPASRSTVYKGDGAVFSPALPGRPLYEAVG